MALNVLFISWSLGFLIFKMIVIELNKLNTGANTQISTFVKIPIKQIP